MARGIAKNAATGEFVHAFSPNEDSPAGGSSEVPRAEVRVGAAESISSLLTLLRDRTLPARIIEELLEKWSPLTHRPAAVRAFLRHPALGRASARRLIENCPWRPLAEAIADPLTPSKIKPMLEASLLAALESTSIGETITLARMAAGRVLRTLLEHDDAGVLMACAENPKLEPSDMQQLLAREMLPAGLLEGLSRSARWSQRRDILRSLAVHPRASPRTVLRCLRKLDESEIEQVARDDKAPHYPREVAGAILRRNAKERKEDRRGT